MFGYQELLVISIIPLLIVLVIVLLILMRKRTEKAILRLPEDQRPTGTADHPQATTVLVLGILSIFIVFLAPIAWGMGNGAMKDCKRGWYKVDGQLKAGRALGIVFSILLTIAVVVLIIGGLLGGAFNAKPPSTEQISDDSATVIAYTGQDQVYWVADSKVYHLCAEYPEGTTIPALSSGDADTNPVVSGTVAQAVQAGKYRLSLYGYTECGYTEGQPQYGTLPGSGAASNAGSAPATSPEPTATHS